MCSRAKLRNVLMMQIAIFVSPGQSDVIGSRERVYVTIGDDAVLSCHLEREFDLKTQTVEWRRAKTIVHVYRNNENKSEINHFS